MTSTTIDPLTATSRNRRDQARPGRPARSRMLWKSVPDALRKLNPRTLWRNPVMFIVEIGAAWSTVLAIVEPSWFAWLIVVWLWLTVVFANLAEAVAEGRARRRPRALRKTKTDTMARRLVGWAPGPRAVKRKCPLHCCNRATSWWSKPARQYRATAMSWKALPPLTSRQSPVSRRLSSASPAATGPRSPAARRCYRPRPGGRRRAGRKAYALHATAELLSEPRPGPVPVHVRVNALRGPLVRGEVGTLATLPGLAGLRLPKVDGVADVVRVARWAQDAGGDAGLPACTRCSSPLWASRTPSPSPRHTPRYAASHSVRPICARCWA